MTNTVQRFRNWLKPRLNLKWIPLFIFFTAGTESLAISLGQGLPWWFTAIGVVTGPVVAMSMADMLTGLPASQTVDGEEEEGEEEDLLEYSRQLQQQDSQ